MFYEIPTRLPKTPLLDLVNNPTDLRQLLPEQLLPLADELRAYLLYCVGQTGGHFGAGLGVVELTLALHYAFNTPEDRLVWDVGHQTYPHKILTERKRLMSSLRQRHGLKGFPSRSESLYDTFGVGHSSTSISAALGMALGAQMSGEKRHVVSVIGDGAMTAGMAFEALNHAGHLNANLLVVLNDNRMSISENVGGLSNYFARIWASRTYNALRASGKKVLKDMPSAMHFARRTEEHMKSLVSPGTLFEELGFNYIGPIDGHNITQLTDYFQRIKLRQGPQLLHVLTQKGKGFAPAESDPIGYHALNKIEPKASKPPPARTAKVGRKYSDVFGDWLCEMAEMDPCLVGITPAMREGSGMVKFSQAFPKRYHDVAIAEQHSVTFAAGLACEGQKPVVAIYSTFLQRAYDQLIHDVAIQKLNVLFAIDRAGLVGEDGPTHAGVYDLSFLRCIPELVVMAPSDEAECRQLLYTGFCHPGPAAVRYPRGSGPGAVCDAPLKALPIGKANRCREGHAVALLAFGSMLAVAMPLGEELNATVVDMRFVKPLDQALLLELADTHHLLVTLEENAVMGGAGSGVNECLSVAHKQVEVLNLGVPDAYIEQGTPDEMLAESGLSLHEVRRRVLARMQASSFPKLLSEPTPKICLP